MVREQKTNWTISIAQLSMRAGQTKNIDEVFPAPSGIDDTVVGIEEGANTHLKGTLESLSDGLLFTGSVSAPMHGECTRCLKPLDGDWSTNVTAFFTYEDRLASHNSGFVEEAEQDIFAEDDEADDVYPISPSATLLDFESLIRDNLAQTLPVQPLCRPDCKGLCPQCGINLNDNPDHVDEPVNIRWAQLEQLKAQLESQQNAE